MVIGTDINSQILDSNHLLNIQVNYKLEVYYKRPIELKVISTLKNDLTISEFLVYAGERMNFDYVDLLFGKYNQITYDELKKRLTENSQLDLKGITERLDFTSNILTIDETRSCQSFCIQTNKKYHFLLENWQI